MTQYRGEDPEPWRRFADHDPHAQLETRQGDGSGARPVIVVLAFLVVSFGLAAVRWAVYLVERWLE